MRVAGHNDQCQCSECGSSTQEAFYDPSATYNPNQMMLGGVGLEMNDPQLATIRREMTLSGGIQLTPIEQGIVDARFNETDQPRGPDGRWITNQEAVAMIARVNREVGGALASLTAQRQMIDELRAKVDGLENALANAANESRDLVAGQRRELDELFAAQRDALAAMRTDLQSDLSSVMGALEDLKAERAKVAKR